MSTTRRMALMAALAAAIYLLKQNQKALKRSSNSSSKSTKKGGKKKNPMTQIFWLLWPFNKSKAEIAADPDARVGQFELVAIFTISVLRTWHQNRMVYIKRDLMEATYRRNNDMFGRIIKETVVLSVLSSMIFAAHRYLKERLTLVWREKVTKQLHRRYFNGMSYYKLSHLNKQKIADVEERITRDPRRFCKGLADEMEKASAALTSGIWFTYKLTTISSLPYAVSPLCYFYVAFRISMTLAPNWSKRWRGMLDRRGTYQKAQSRLQTHSEAICAYQGNTQERQIIDNYWHNFLSYCVHFVKDASLFQFVTSALFEYGGHSFAEALIVGKFISPSNITKQELVNAGTTKEKMEASAKLFSELRFMTEYFIRAMSAQGTIIAVLRQLQNMKGPAKRLTELYDTLDEFEKHRESSTTFKNDMETIAFKDVQVYTPTGHLLVKDLNFSISHGTSMLLTGCNGSGKSSIFRCLGSLWKVPEGGLITKPGGNEPGLNASVFYLPQKPYNVLGTLKDQLSYPEFQSKTSTISNEELKALLDEVDLGYLIERDHDKEINWEKTLSLGEQQRLAMARLFYHKPRFAILDECTSGVSASMERRLYESCVAQGITCITISHRPVLEQYHDVVLNILADGKGGWSWRKTKKNAGKDEISGEKEVGGYSQAYLNQGQGNALLEKKTLEKRSKPYVELAKANPASKKSLPKVSTKKRFADILNKLMPKGASMSDPEFHRVLFLISLVVGKTVLADAIARYDGYIISTVLQNDWWVFVKAVGSGAFFRTFLAFFDAQMMRQKWYLNLEWRRRLTAYLMDLYFKRNTFYDIKNLDSRIADPDERITEQVEQLSISLTELWTSLLKPAFDITFNTVMLYRTLGFSGVTYTSGYMFAGLLAMRYVVPNFRQIQKKEYELEGRFRFVHNRLINHTESIAFFGGDEVELEVANKRFDNLKSHIQGAQLETFRFNIFNNFTIKQTPDIVAFALRMLYARGFLTDASVVDQGGSDISAGGEYIQQTVMRSFRSFGEAFDLQETIGQFIGTLENVSDLMYTLEDLTKDSSHSESLLRSNNNDEIEFKNVDIVAPGETCVVSNLDLKIKQGHPIIVTGPNAAGKSSLFRTLGGLWPIPKGTIKRPCNEQGIVTPKEVFLVPQKPYSVTGSLADQITYPHSLPAETRTAEEEAFLTSLMSLVGIEYLVAREGGWDAVQKWEDVLSLGEQQRLGCARLFFHNPAFAVLDECTSAVSADVEALLYKAAHDRGITSITISQRLALEEFHDEELKMGDANGDDGWAIRKIQH